jgi:hypothetical protein
MSVTYPRDFATQEFSAVDFNLDRYVSQNLLYGGQTQAREQAEARWRATFTTRPFFPLHPTELAELGKWQAWWDSLRSSRQFLAYDPIQPFPIAYPNGAGLGSWNGVGGVSSISAFSLTCTGVVSGFAVKAGDLVGLTQSGRYSLHRILLDRTASGTTLSSLTVEPAINTTLFTTSAACHFIKPKVLMIPVVGSYTAPKGLTAAPVAFEGIQVLY